MFLEMRFKVTPCPSQGRFLRYPRNVDRSTRCSGLGGELFFTAKHTTPLRLVFAGECMRPRQGNAIVSD